MGFFTRVFSHVKSGISTDEYYKSMNQALMRLNAEYTMLHYPYYMNDKDSFFDAQKNLTDYCMSKLEPVKGKSILEIGCGNGVQAEYILERYRPETVIAIDLNPSNIEIAREEAKKKGLENLKYNIDDAQKLSTIKSNSIDYVINIESAFHYPDKPAFFREIFRVLKPGGIFLIADIMTKPKRGNRLRSYWKGKMNYHHWPVEEYENELEKANLQVRSFNDITREVILGFKRYRYWLSNMKKKHFIEDTLLKLYYTIHVQLNIRLLRKSRQYCVIVGQRSA